MYISTGRYLCIENSSTTLKINFTTIVTSKLKKLFMALDGRFRELPEVMELRAKHQRLGVRRNKLRVRQQEIDLEIREMYIKFKKKHPKQR